MKKPYNRPAWRFSEYSGTSCPICGGFLYTRYRIQSSYRTPPIKWRYFTDLYCQLGHYICRSGCDRTGIKIWGKWIWCKKLMDADVAIRYQVLIELRLRAAQDKLFSRRSRRNSRFERLELLPSNSVKNLFFYNMQQK